MKIKNKFLSFSLATLIFSLLMLNLNTIEANALLKTNSIKIKTFTNDQKPSTGVRLELLDLDDLSQVYVGYTNNNGICNIYNQDLNFTSATNKKTLLLTAHNGNEIVSYYFDGFIKDGKFENSTESEILLEVAQPLKQVRTADWQVQKTESTTAQWVPTFHMEVTNGLKVTPVLSNGTRATIKGTVGLASGSVTLDKSTSLTLLSHTGDGSNTVIVETKRPAVKVTYKHIGTGATKQEILLGSTILDNRQKKQYEAKNSKSYSSISNLNYFAVINRNQPSVKISESVSYQVDLAPKGTAGGVSYSGTASYSSNKGLSLTYSSSFSQYSKYGFYDRTNVYVTKG